MKEKIKKEIISINDLSMPHKCKVCDIGEIKNAHDICEICGWEADPLQEANENYTGGANHLSINQYKEFWNDKRDEILKADNTCFKAIELAKKFYELHFKNK